MAKAKANSKARKSPAAPQKSHEDSEIEAMLAEVEADEGSTAAEVVTAEAAAPGEAEKPKNKRICTAGMRPSQIIETKIGDRVTEVAIFSTGDTELSGVKLKNKIAKTIEGFDTLPKKCGEKVVNVLTHLASGITLSVYTREAVKLLVNSKDGMITTDDLRNHYLAPNPRPYSAGTASAQTSQMWSVLPALGIADRDGKNLVLRDDSVLAEMLANAPDGREDVAEAA